MPPVYYTRYDSKNRQWMIGVKVPESFEGEFLDLFPARRDSAAPDCWLIPLNLQGELDAWIKTLPDYYLFHL